MINFTGQDIWQEPIADICSETKVVLFIIIVIISLKSTNICLKLECLVTFTISSQKKDLFKHAVR